MTAITFDALGALRELRSAGVDEKHAEAMVSAFSKTAVLPDTSDLASKQDLSLLRQEMLAIEQRTIASFSEKLRLQGWAVLGGVAILNAATLAIVNLLR